MMVMHIRVYMVGVYIKYIYIFMYTIIYSILRTFELLAFISLLVNNSSNNGTYFSLNIGIYSHDARRNSDLILILCNQNKMNIIVFRLLLWSSTHIHIHIYFEELRASQQFEFCRINYARSESSEVFGFRDSRYARERERKKVALRNKHFFWLFALHLMLWQDVCTHKHNLNLHVCRTNIFSDGLLHTLGNENTERCAMYNNQ